LVEVGLLPFARGTLQVTTAVLLSYRSRLNKHKFTQLQLLAILCLRRREDWIFREAEMQYGEAAICACRVLLTRRRSRAGENCGAPAQQVAKRAGGAPASGWGKGLAQRTVPTFLLGDASSRTETAAVTALAEVNGCGRSGSAVRGVAGIKILLQVTIFPVVNYRFSRWVLTPFRSCAIAGSRIRFPQRPRGLPGD